MAYVAVPPVARLVQSMAGYAPGSYEPKDRDREAWLRHAVGDGPLLRLVSWRTLVSAVLFAIVAVVWLTL
ncbi:MAG TPA: hypothetical protein VFX28_17420, partial [Methylomirabilota bacterium]|nr:hypothetical protein [Methylomirabilota bacterium]